MMFPYQKNMAWRVSHSGSRIYENAPFGGLYGPLYKCKIGS